MGGVISSGKNPIIPFLLQNKKAGKVKVNTGFIKIVIGLNKVREKIKTLREVISFFTWSFINSEWDYN